LIELSEEESKKGNQDVELIQEEDKNIEGEKRQTSPMAEDENSS